MEDSKMREKRSGLIAILVIAVMLTASIGVAMAEPNHTFSGRDKNGSYSLDGKSARVGWINSICIEGLTTDANNTCLYGLDPSGTNRIHFPDSSGTVSLTSDAFAGALADTQIYIGQSTGLGAAKAMSGKVAITNAGVTTLPDTTDANIFVSNAVSMQSVTMSGDATIANSGALTIGSNKIDVTRLFYNTVTLVIAAGTAVNSVAVEAGSLLIDTQPSAGFSNDYTLIESGPSVITGSWLVRTDAHPADMIVNGVFIRP
jgi:hypothetical protein